MEQDFHTPEQFQPRAWLHVDGKPVVWEACQTLNGSWGYDRDNLDWKSPAAAGADAGGRRLQGRATCCSTSARRRGGSSTRGRWQTLAAIGEWTRLHGRSIYGCTQARRAHAAAGRALHLQPARRTASTCTSSPGRSSTSTWTGWPAGSAYAQLLHDASEVRSFDFAQHHRHPGAGEETLTLELPIQRPEVLVPVVELFLEG